MGIRKDIETDLIKEANKTAKSVNSKSTAKTPTKEKKPRQVKPPLSKKLASGQPKEVYMQLCEDIAARMSDTVSGRDYSSMSKSFLDSYQKYLDALDAENETEEEVPSAIATLQIQLQQRNKKALDNVEKNR